MAQRVVEFGYNPPTGDRGLELFGPDEFMPGLRRCLDFASQHFSSLWVSDHFGSDGKFRIECWTQLMWIAARYPGPMLGTCVMAQSFRHPPLLAKMAASLQFMSGGRFILGYGGGWLADEYAAYGYEFPSARTRIEQMVEGIEVMRALWTQSPATYEGRYFQIKDASSSPRPDPIPPIMIGGDGERYLLPAVAKHADWWLTYASNPDTHRHKIEVLREQCQAIGRDYASIKKATPVIVYLKRDRAEAERWAGSALERENPPFAGNPAGLREYLAARVELGFDQFQMAFAGFPETDDLQLFVDEVLPAFR
jgi:alkanesulfonate monooxygenase SsuD/methylene tetrahydromethanopterin reductase-like flavin-dependent oxidoreductase (luciferase family)